MTAIVTPSHASRVAAQIAELTRMGARADRIPAMAEAYVTEAERCEAAEAFDAREAAENARLAAEERAERTAQREVEDRAYAAHLLAQSEGARMRLEEIEAGERAPDPSGFFIALCARSYDPATVYGIGTTAREAIDDAWNGARPGQGRPKIRRDAGTYQLTAPNPIGWDIPCRDLEDALDTAAALDFHVEECTEEVYRWLGGHRLENGRYTD